MSSIPSLVGSFRGGGSKREGYQKKNLGERWGMLHNFGEGKVTYHSGTSLPSGFHYDAASRVTNVTTKDT